MTAAPALARNTNIFSSSFGAASSTPADPYPLSSPTDVAVDNSSGTSAHDVYVADSANHRIEKFDSAGNFILMFGKDVNETTGGNVCTASSGDTCKAGLSGSEPGEFKTPTFVAVDGSSDPSAGDVYVGDTGDGRVSKFEPSGELIGSWGTNGQLTGFNPMYGIAVDQSGNLFVLTGQTSWYDESGQFHSNFGYPRGTSQAGLAVDSEDHLYKADGDPEITKFTDTGENLGEPDGTDAAVGLAIDPTTNDLYVDEGGSYINHFGFNCGQYCVPEDSFGSGHLSNAEGLSVEGTTHTVYVANTGEGDVAAFTAVILPNVTTKPATEVIQTSATLTGSLEPAGGGNVTGCHFEYGTNTEYTLGSVPCEPKPPYSGATEVTAKVSGLTAETTYHFRLVAANSNGSIEGQDESFTPHAVTDLCTEPVTEIARTSATLNGCFTGNGEATQYYFEWGTTEEYGHKTPVEAGGSPASGEHVTKSFDLTGLTTETTYHYRFVAENTFGTTHGSDQSFETYGAVEGLATKPAVEIEADAATLIGSFSGDGEDTHYYFEWGTSESYGNKTELKDAGSPGAHQAVNESVQVSGLTPFTTYDYRFVAENTTGITRGKNISVMTLGRYQFSGEEGTAGEGKLDGPESVAVDESTGDIYVADTGNHRIVKFDSEGHFLAAWGWGVSNGESKSEVCTTSCQAGLSGSGSGEFNSPTFIAVDNSAGPSAGDVYVGDTANKNVQKFEPTGQLITNWGSDGSESYSSGIAGIAVNAEGTLIVAPGNGRGIAINSFGQTVSAGNGVAVERSTNDLFEDTEFQIEQETFWSVEVRNPGGTLVDSVGMGILKSSSGLGLNQSTKTLYVANTGANSIAVFTPLPAPGVITSSVADLGISSASLTGHVNPNGGGPIGACYFEYIDTTAIKNEVQTLTVSGAKGGSYTLSLNGEATGEIGYNASAGEIENALQALAEIGSGNVSVGGVQGGPYLIEFKGTMADRSVPQLMAQSAGLTPTGASAAAETTTVGYGSNPTRVPCSPPTPISSPMEVSAEVTSLTPFDTYEYRLVASSKAGKGFPIDGHFQTFVPAPSLAPEITETASSEVTPTTARLSAGVNANSSPTTYRFEYGPTTNYGSTTLASGPIASHVVGYSGGGNREIGQFGRGEIGAAGGISYSSEGSGTIYVADNSVDQVRVFEREAGAGESGKFLAKSSFGSEGSTVGKFRTMGGLAVESATGDVFVADIGNKRVEKFKRLANGSYGLLSEITGTGSHQAFSETSQVPQDVAVDNSSGPSKGDIYVVLRNNESHRAVVDKFQPKQVEPKEYEYVCQLTGPGGGCKPDPAQEGGSADPFLRAQGVATDAEGNVYVAAEKKVYEFAEDGAELAALGGFGSATASLSVTGSDLYVTTSSEELFRLEINPETHAVEGEDLVDPAGSRWVTTDTSGNVYTIDQELLGENSSPHTVVAPIANLTPGTTYHYRVVAVNLNGEAAGPDQTFNTTDTPIVSETTVGEVGESTATIKAKIQPGFSPTTYRVEYGLSTGYGSSTPESATIGTDNSAHGVTDMLTGLRPETTYHLRVVGTNAIGSKAGSDVSFTTGAVPSAEQHLVSPPKTCRKGYVKKHGRCVKKSNPRRKKHRGKR